MARPLTNRSGKPASAWSLLGGILLGCFLLAINFIWTYLVVAGRGDEVPMCGRRHHGPCTITANDDPTTPVVAMWVLVGIVAMVWLGMPGRGIVPGLPFLALAGVVTVGHFAAERNHLSAPDYSLHAGIALCIGVLFVIIGLVRVYQHRDTPRRT
jgi:hypothetical protein